MQKRNRQTSIKKPPVLNMVKPKREEEKRGEWKQKLQLK
jgi:hypothetical protein